MGDIALNIQEIKTKLPDSVSLVAVSKTKPNSDILEAYQSGQRIFGENKVQEMCEKFEALPKDIAWHMIGHLQSNKVKYIAPFVSLTHGVDSVKLLKEISKQAVKNNRVIDCLLQVFVAQEETKFGFDFNEVKELVLSSDFETRFPMVKITGLMAMASNVDDEEQVSKEFSSVKQLFEEIKKSIQNPNIEMNILSMGMSGDYLIAVSNGSNMVRLGSSIFGERKYKI